MQNDFLSGRNGACKVSVTELEFLNKFGKLMNPVRPAFSNETTFSNSVKSVAEHLCNVADGRPRPFADSKFTYDQIKDLLFKIQSCGYFEKNIKFVAEEKPIECEVVVAVDEQESENDDSEGKVEDLKDMVQAPAPSQIPAPTFAVTLPVVQSAPIPVVQPQQMQPQQQQNQSTGIASNNKNQPPTTVRAVERAYFVHNQMKYVQQSPPQQQQQHHQVPIMPVQQQQQHPNKPLATNNPIHDVISSGNFFFLQDSELDTPAEVPLAKQQGNIVSLPSTVVQTPQQQPPQTQHQQQQQPQSTISTQTFTNQNYHQQQQQHQQHQQQPRDNVVHSIQIYAPPGLNLQPQGVPQQQQQHQQTAHIPNYQSTQQHSTNQSQASSQIIPNQQQKQQIAGFATVQSSVNPQQPRPYPPILPPAHFQHMQQQQKTAQPLPNEQQTVQKLDTESLQSQPILDSQTRSPSMQEQEKKRDDWSAQQQQPPQIDTWTNETANGAPSTNSNYNSTRPSSGYNRSSGNRTSGGGKYGNGNGGVQSNGGYRSNNGIQDNYR